MVGSLANIMQQVKHGYGNDYGWLNTENHSSSPPIFRTLFTAYASDRRVLTDVLPHLEELVVAEL